MADNVRFIRVRGKVVPIRGTKNEVKKSRKSNSSAPKKALLLKVSTRKISAGERFESGFKTGSTFGGVVGGVAGAALSGAKTWRSLIGSTVLGAASNALSWGVGVGAVSAAIGPRNGLQVSVGKLKKKKQK